MEELTPHIEELKRVVGEKASEEELIDELNTYLNVYHVSIEAAVKGIKRKYGDETPLFVTASSIAKKIKEMTGDEKNVDLVAKIVYIEEKQITARGVPKTIFSGILGDETGTIPFTVWDVGKFELVKGETYNFKNAYGKKWNDKVQLNFSERSTAEVSATPIKTPERTISYSGDVKISELREGLGNVTVTGKIVSAENKTITSKGETKTVLAGYIADDTGKVQFTSWNDLGLKVDEAVCAKNAYVRVWRGIPQLNFGDQCEISRVDGIFQNIQSGLNKRSIADIIKVGGGLDIAVTGTIVDVRTGTGLIKRCPECNRSIIGDECTSHGKVEAVNDLRMKIVIDDGTGALSSIVTRDATESLTGITLDAAMAMASDKGDQDAVLKAIDEKVLIMNVTAVGNVLSDDYGPMMIVREIKQIVTDMKKEAEELMVKVEASL
jgi:replication factor A1